MDTCSWWQFLGTFRLVGTFLSPDQPENYSTSLVSAAETLTECPENRTTQSHRNTQPQKTWNHRKTELQNQRNRTMRTQSQDTQNHRNTEPQEHGTTEKQNHRTKETEPQEHRITETCTVFMLLNFFLLSNIKDSAFYSSDFNMTRIYIFI